MGKDLEDLIDQDEMASLAEKYGDFTRRHVTIEMQKTSLDHYRKINKSRRGEILFALTRPDGSVMLHTKHFYPDGVYRLPTGGIDWGEPVAETFHREVQEETQFTVSGERFIGVLSYSFTNDGKDVPFVSYLFHAGNIEGKPEPYDTSEGITDFSWIAPAELTAVAEQLRNLEEDEEGRHDWGVFRAVAHDMLLEFLS